MMVKLYRFINRIIGAFLMSLGIAVKGSEGIVLAADSRVTLTAILAQQPGAPANVQVQLPVNFDNATKLLTFGKPNNWIGAVTFGDAVIGTTASDLRTAQSFIPEFEVGLPEERLSVQDFAQKLSDFYLQQWNAKMPPTHPGGGMVFVVAGFNADQPYGSVYMLNIPNAPTPAEQSPNDFGVTWGGQHELTARLLQGYDPRILDIAKNQLKLKTVQINLLCFQRLGKKPISRVSGAIARASRVNH